MPDSGYSRSPILLKGALVELSKGFLGPVPNIIMEGSGKGFQLDMELRHAIRDAWELGAGFRYWRLRATRGNRLAAGTNLPMTELESKRSGLLLSLTRRW